MYLKDYLFAPIAIVSMVLTLLIYALILPAFDSEIFTGDGGPIDYLTYFFYFLALFLFFHYRRDFKEKKCVWLALTLLVIMALFREMGVQHWLTSTDTTAFKLHFFTNPNNPLFEKIRAGAILLVLLGIVIYLLFRYFLFLFKGFFKKNPLATTICFTLGMLVVCKLIDRIPSLLRKKGDILLSRDAIAWFSMYEEGLEILLPFFVCVALMQHHALKENA